MDEVEKRIEDTMRALDEMDPVTVRRLKVWDLRIKGHALESIAALLDCSVGTAHRDLRWCLDNLPAAYDSVEDFRRVSLRRLDEQITRLSAPVVDGQPVAPTEQAERVIHSAMDMQAKLLGGYAPTQVDGTVHVKYTLESGGDDDV